VARDPQIKRSDFLSLVGAAVSAPLMPNVSRAAPIAAAGGAAIVNQHTYGMAALHLRMRPSMTAADLTARFNLLADQVQAQGFGSALTRTKGQKTRYRDRSHGRQRIQTRAQAPTDPSFSIPHLRCVYVSNGTLLHPRCIA
jgi:hypothetical protein